MWSYVYMKLLEGRPRHYDTRMARASRGHVVEAKREVVARLREELAPSDGAAARRVVDIGAGTGELGAMLVEAGFRVHGFDANPEMVRVARERIQREGLADRMTVEHRTVADMDGLPDDAWDAAVSTLVLSELDPDARRYALTHTRRVLRPGGLAVMADEVWPRGPGRRALHRLRRAPALALTYLVTGAASHPWWDLPGALEDAGFTVIDAQRSQRDAFAVVTARTRAAEAREDEP